MLNNLNTNAQQQQQFIFQLTQLIKSEKTYGSGVELLTYKIKDNNDIEGKFRDSWNKVDGKGTRATIAGRLKALVTESDIWNATA